MHAQILVAGRREADTPTQIVLNGAMDVLKNGFPKVYRFEPDIEWVGEFIAQVESQFT